MGKCIELTGRNLSASDVCNIARGLCKVSVSTEAIERLVESRKLVFELSDKGVPIYGCNRGVGWNKDKKVTKEFVSQFNKKYAAFTFGWRWRKCQHRRSPWCNGHPTEQSAGRLHWTQPRDRTVDGRNAESQYYTTVSKTWLRWRGRYREPVSFGTSAHW